jgi:hypothetical protein
MKRLQGAREYDAFKKGAKLTRAQAMKAYCYMCNGEDESHCDCEGTNCPMYQYRLYPNKKAGKVPK